MIPRNLTDFVSSAGSAVEPKFTGTFDHGQLNIVPVGSHNVQDEIQSYHDDCCFNSLLSRYLNGDIDALSSVNNRGSGDLVDVPKTLMAVYNARSDMQSIFNGLPDEIRSALGSVSNLDEAYSNGTLAEALKRYSDAQEEASKPKPIPVYTVDNGGNE